MKNFELNRECDQIDEESKVSQFEQYFRILG